MSNKRFEMHEIRQIIFHLRQGESLRAIMRSKLADRKKIRKVREIAIREDWLNLKKNLPTDEELASFFKPNLICQSSLTLPYQQQIEEWFKKGIQTTTIHAALQKQYHFAGSYHSVHRYVKKLKNKLPAVTVMLDFKPGECAQVDFGAGPVILDEETGEKIKTWIFVMVLAWSRHLYAEIVLRQDVETWLGCHRRAFEWFHGVPSKLLVDNAKCAITKACYHDPEVQRSYREFAEAYGVIISACPPYDPPKKHRIAYCTSLSWLNTFFNACLHETILLVLKYLFVPHLMVHVNTPLYHYTDAP